MFLKETRRQQSGTWEVRNLGEDDWSRGDNQSYIKEGKRGIPILVFLTSFTKQRFQDMDMFLLYPREDNSISKCFLQQRYRDVVISMLKSIVFEN